MSGMRGIGGLFRSIKISNVFVYVANLYSFFYRGRTDRLHRLYRIYLYKI